MGMFDDVFGDSPQQQPQQGKMFDDVFGDQKKEPGMLDKLKTAAASSAFPGAYFFTEPGRKVVSDAAGAVKDYAVGAYQGLQESVRRQNDVENMFGDDAGSHTNPRWGGGEFKADQYTQGDLQNALNQQSNADTAFVNETVAPAAMISGGVVAPHMTMAAILGTQAAEGYNSVEGTPLQKAGNAVRQATYGPFVDIITDPNAKQKFEQNPGRMAANTGMAALQALYPVERTISGISGVKQRIAERMEPVMDRVVGKSADELFNEIQPVEQPTQQPKFAPVDDAPAQYTVSEGVDFSIKPEAVSRVESLIKAYNREFPDDPITITDGMRSPDAGYGSPTSWHKAGEAVDFVAPGLETNAEQRARFVELAKEHGFQEVLDEYSDPSAYATGGHVHVGGLGENAYTPKYEPRTATQPEILTEEPGYTADQIFEQTEPTQRAMPGTENHSIFAEQPDINPVTRKQIINELDNIITTRFGKLLSNDALGEFKVNAETIRAINHGDFRTLAHEVGHFLDKKLNLSDPAFDAELTGWADRKWGNVKEYQKYTPEQRRAEGLAEFVSQYMTDPQQARRNFPNYFNAFEPIMEQNPVLRTPINSVGKLMQTWYRQSPEARARGGMSFGYENQRKSILQRGKDAWLKFYETMVDDKVLLDKAVKDVERISGDRIANEKNPYKLSLMARDSATARAMMLVEEKNPAMVKTILNRIYNRAIKEPVTMRSILEGLDEKALNSNNSNYLKQGNFKNWMEAFSTYIAARRTTELIGAKPDYVSSMSYADAATLIKNAPAEFAPLAEKVYKYNDNLLRIAVKENMLSVENYMNLKDQHKEYVPFMRDFVDEAAMENFFSGKGYGNVASPIKRLSDTGSSEAIINPLETMIKNTYAFLNAVERNRVGRAFVELSKQPGAGRLVELVSGSSDANHSVFTVWDKGKKLSYQTTPELYNALMSLNQEGAKFAVEILSHPAGWLRAGATLTPEFIARNIMRDSVAAWVYSKHGFIPVYDTFKGLAEVIGKTELYQEYKASGAMMSTIVSLDRKYTRESINKLLSTTSIGKMVAEYNPLAILRDLSDVMENATRIAEYGKSRNNGGSIIEAGLDAKDVTLNFSRAGAFGRKYNKVTAFFNAAIQGGDKMARAFREDPKGTSLRTALYVTLPSVLLYLYNKDDMRYQELPRWQKDLFWIIPVGNKVTRDEWNKMIQAGKKPEEILVNSGTLLRIPKPQELGIIFGTGAERMLEWMDKKDSKSLKNWLKSVGEAVMPNLMPTVLTPLVEWWTNYSLFTDRPIVPQREQNFPEKMQYGPYTSEVSKFVGEKFNVSPRKIDNTIRGYGGGMARMGTGIIDWAVGKDDKLPARKWNEYPGVRGITVTPFSSPQSIQDFYDRLNEMEKEYKGSGKNSPPSELSNMRKTNTMLTDIHKQQRKIMDSNISSEEKRRKLDALDSVELKLTQNALSKQKK